MQGGEEQQSDDMTPFAECWHLKGKMAYILRLTLSAGIGGLLFGYDTGAISGASLYIREDFRDVNQKTRLRETIVSMAVVGAIIGAGFGGWMNDRFGRKKSILLADIVFFLGPMVMAFALSPHGIIIGRILVGLGIGMASVTSPLYIAEASPARIRGALVSMNGLLITGGQFVSDLVNMAFSNYAGTWRWVHGIAGIPAVIQFFLVLSLPESPRWLYRQNKVEEARSILEKIYPPNEVEDEMKALQESIEAEKLDESMAGGSLFARVKVALGSPVIWRGLRAGITVQVVQQLVGINAIMYYGPTIVQFTGFASNTTIMALSLLTSGLNAVGSIICMAFVDKLGRRRLMIMSMFGITTCLVALCLVFAQASLHTPGISQLESSRMGWNSTCPAYASEPYQLRWNCRSCLKAQCGFCGNGPHCSGACLASTEESETTCRKKGWLWFEDGCPSRYGILTIVILGLYIISYSPGIGTVPWVVNSEIYPLRHRGTCGGIAAVANWCTNLIVSETFLTSTGTLGSYATFLAFAGFSTVGLMGIYFLVPETRGLRFEDIERLLQDI
ncbi:hypothetical protein MLD38_037316 [Melastoma candidum]|uniref:Uncharacterized protein n=1 Tax=Melastoma candidum TaxID=119954 RepID=A0ACB9LMX6_9MYRT|nr:hypothetical protein MLD38_037316 [Melastoma candidum]